MTRLQSDHAAGGPPWALAWRLAGGQLVAWGVLYYAFTVVVGPMEAATGWSRSFLNAGVTTGFLAWGLCAYPAGVWIHRHGARGLMTVASAVGGLALVMVGLATAPAGYLLAWLLLGAAMAGLLYEPAFVVVVDRFGAHYQRGITVITLVGGLASTVFIPAAQGLVEWVGWRPALVLLGLFQAVVGSLLHWHAIPASAMRSGAVRTAAPPPLHAGTPAARCDRRFAGLALWFAAHAAAFSGTLMLLVPVLQDAGLARGSMLGAIMLIGPMQVAGRLALLRAAGRHPALRLAQWATATLIVSLALLTVARPGFAVLAVFAILFGAANGVMTILRSTVVAEMYGRDRYAQLSGALALPAVLARAGAPWLLAALAEASGTDRAVFGGALALAATGAVGLGIAARRPARGESPASGSRRAAGVGTLARLDAPANPR